jgi:hypothetical protein
MRCPRCRTNDAAEQVARATAPAIDNKILGFAGEFHLTLSNTTTFHRTRIRIPLGRPNTYTGRPINLLEVDGNL